MSIKELIGLWNSGLATKDIKLYLLEKGYKEIEIDNIIIGIEIGIRL